MGEANDFNYATYGVCRLMPLAHLSADKQQWPHTSTVGPVVAQGRRHGGSVHGSEMEISHGLARGTPNILRCVPAAALPAAPQAAAPPPSRGSESRRRLTTRHTPSPGA